MKKDNSRWARSLFKVHTTPEPINIAVKGRDRWALECLMNAGNQGCTPIDHPGPRWSAYVHKLRGFGVDIETVHEGHDGPFSGTHARYVLRSHIEAIGDTSSGAGTNGQ